jgi:CRISPR-associated protein Cas1
MIKRTLYFGNPSYLSIQNEQLHIRFPDVERNATSEEVKKQAFTTVPIEDIGVVVLDHAQITISHFVLHKLMANNVALITCNEQHMPCGLLMPLEGNTVQAERYKYQLEASVPLKKQLWQQTVQAKINNQAYVIEHDATKRRLYKMTQDVKSGDVTNFEGQAAALYWKHFFYPNPFFRQREGEAPNNLLNYGYALLRATMARSLVASGLMPTLGIFHRNRYNAYALADDMMEPYRPFVDKMVLEIVKKNSSDLTLDKAIKAEFLSIPAMDVIINGEKSPMMIAMQRTSASLVRCFEGKQRKLLLPEME